MTPLAIGTSQEKIMNEADEYLKRPSPNIGYDSPQENQNKADDDDYNNPGWDVPPRPPNMSTPKLVTVYTLEGLLD